MLHPLRVLDSMKNPSLAAEQSSSVPGPCVHPEASGTAEQGKSSGEPCEEGPYFGPEVSPLLMLAEPKTT
jgi:hypothetical protein